MHFCPSISDCSLSGSDFNHFIDAQGTEHGAKRYFCPFCHGRKYFCRTGFYPISAMVITVLGRNLPTLNVNEPLFQYHPSFKTALWDGLS